MSQLHLKDLQLHCTRGPSPSPPFSLRLFSAGRQAAQEPFFLSWMSVPRTDVGSGSSPPLEPCYGSSLTCVLQSKNMFFLTNICYSHNSFSWRCVCVCATVKMWKQPLQWKYYHRGSFEHVTRCLYATKSPEKIVYAQKPLG